MIAVVATIIAVLVALPSIYLGALGLLASLPQQRPTRTAGATRKFAVIVPAHNEAARIGDSLESLARQSYPPEKYQVIVVADNCTDDTAAIGRARGAKVVERHDTSNRGKGYALAAGLEHLEADAGAVLFVDGDCTISENALAALNSVLALGARAVQCRYEMAIEAGSATGAARRLALALVHVVRPLAKERLRASTGLKGSGMCFDRSLIDALGWKNHGLAEDIEQHIALLQAGERVVYEYDVLVMGSAPTRLADAREQQERWEAGRISAASQHGFPLLLRGLRSRSLPMVDAAIELLVPPLSVLGAALVAATLVTVVFGGQVAVIAILVAWISIVWYIVAGVTRANLRARDVASMVITLPVYAVWKIVLYAKAVIVRPTTWKPTHRDG